MKKQQGKRISYVFSIMLMITMAWFTAGCNGRTEKEVPPAAGQEEKEQKDSGGAGTVMGEGSKSFPFTVVDKEGKETLFEIHTEKEMVGEALLELGLIDGEESEYGLYVKTVNGITADYDNDGVYWAFYINGEYAQTGVDATTVGEGDQYSFKIQ